jgi:hypothetical protein
MYKMAKPGNINEEKQIKRAQMGCALGFHARGEYEDDACPHSRSNELK